MLYDITRLTVSESHARVGAAYPAEETWIFEKCVTFDGIIRALGAVRDGDGRYADTEKKCTELGAWRSSWTRSNQCIAFRAWCASDDDEGTMWSSRRKLSVCKAEWCDCFTIEKFKTALESFLWGEGREPERDVPSKCVLVHFPSRQTSDSVGNSRKVL